MTHEEYWAAQLEANLGKLVDIHVTRASIHTGGKGILKRLDGGAWVIYTKREVAVVPIGQNAMGQTVGRPEVIPETHLVFFADDVFALTISLETVDEAREKLRAEGVEVPPPVNAVPQRVVPPSPHLFMPKV